MLTRKYFPALQKTEILPENTVSETRNYTLDHVYKHLCFIYLFSFCLFFNIGRKFADMSI